MSMETKSEDRSLPEQIKIRAENIGGIDETEVPLYRGVTALTGRNATNRTSLLQAIMAALGSDKASLKASATEGRAVLEIGDETYERTLTRRNGTVVTEGEPYLEDSTLADLFAFLLESNEARRAVARGDDLRELIMEPVDTEAIQSKIDELERRKREIDERLSELDELESELPRLEQKRTELADEIESLKEQLDEANDRIEAADADLEETREEKQALEEKLDELQSTRSELERTRRQIETERESIEALEAEREDLESQLESLPDSSADKITQLESEIEALQDEKEALTSEISQLQNTIQFNEQMLEDPSGHPLHEQASPEATDEPLTDQLLADSESIVCWTCGSSVSKDQIEATVEQLRSSRKDRLEERNEVSSQLRERRSELDELRNNRQRYQRARNRLDELDDEIEKRSERIDDLQSEREELTDEVADLESAVEDLENEAYAEVLDRHREANQLEFELERKESEREDITERIEAIEEQLEERDRLEDRREDVTATLTDYRTRIDQIEAQAVEEFNEHMENVLDVLEYENLDRIWIRRTEREVRQGRRTVSKTAFDLKVVRSTGDGTAYEDDINHLSESEREVTGLVFALAGYLVHEVYETVPFMLLDSLEAIDSERIAHLVDYFREYVPYLVVALLHEDATALETPHEKVTEI